VETVYYSKPMTPDYYPELEYYARCGRCNHVFMVNEYGKFYCSRKCEIVDENALYLLMSVPSNVPWKRRFNNL
jgi:hypothetical protein